MSERPTLFDSKVLKSRKLHKCCECRKNILCGQRYLCNRGLWGSRWDEFKQCIRCAKLFLVVDSDLRETWCDDGIAFGNLRSTLCEYTWNELKDVIRRSRQVQLTEGE